MLGARAALNLDSECPTGMLVVAFAPRLRQKMRCTMRRELSSAFTATCIDTLGFGQTRHAAVRVSFRPLVVQRDQWDTYWGPKKIIFLIREIDGPKRPDCTSGIQSIVAQKSPRGRIGSVLYTCKRLHRTRNGFHRWVHVGKVLGAR